MANVFDNIVGTEHVVAESSLIKATISGHIYSLKMDKARDNGSIVSRGTFVEEQVFNAADYSASKAPLLLLTTPIGYNTSLKRYSDERYFYNAKDEIGRAYELCEGDIFTVSAMAIDALGDEPVVGNFVQVGSGNSGDIYTEVAKNSASSISGLACEIIEKVNYANGRVSYRLFVTKTM